MRKLALYRLILVSAFLLIGCLIKAQNKIDTSKLEGRWTYNKIEFVEPQDDSTDIRADWNGVVVTFKKGIFTTTKREFKKVGSYQISKDGKTFYQDKMEAEIIRLDNQWFVIKIEEADVILYFKRMVTPK